MVKDLIQGAKYEFLINDNSIRKGLLVSTDEETVFLKLESGYNEGILLKNIKSAKLLEKPKIITKKSVENEKNPEILILHTGGTIASKVDYSTGAVDSMITPEELLALYPELENQKIGSELISNMSSDNMNFSHYNLIAKKIVEVTKKYELKGIILTHGTDTLHYTSAALSFMLKNLPCPLILLGSQRSSDRPSSDASSNLFNAVQFINNHPEYKEVMICMHASINDPESYIFRGTNVRKMHSSARDAFKQINDEPIAIVNYENKKSKILKIKNKKENQEKNQDKNQDKNNQELQIKLLKENLKIGWIKSMPNMSAQEFDNYNDYDALILEGTGLGHFPIIESDTFTKENAKIFEKIKQLSKKLILVMVTQTIYGRVNLNVYSPGRNLKELGILGHNSSLSPETAYIKLAFLLSNYKKEEIKELYNKDFRGEIIERTKGNKDA
jgi:glutamyl-tRNA(Gln) amidotransferase subunit D